MRSEHLVLFDIDGTLLRNAGPHHKRALIEGLRQVTGHAATLDGIPTQGTLDRDLIRGMLRAVGHGEADTVLEKIATQAQAVYLDDCAADLNHCVCAGVRELLEGLRQHGAMLGLVTGNLTHIGWQKMRLAGLRDYFAVGAFSEDGETRAELAATAAARARQLGFAGPGRAISLIGDHPNDILAAKANGFQSIGVASGISTLEELAAANPDILVPNLSQVDAVTLCRVANGDPGH